MKRRVFIGALVLVAMAFSVGTHNARGAAPAARIKVLTFNMWGIVGAEFRQIRAAAIGRQIAELDPDVIALSEAFDYVDRGIVLEHLKKGGYPVHDQRYFRNVYGSGLFIISKYKIEEARFEPWRVHGGGKYIEWLGGKGIAYVRLRTPWGPLEMMHLHVIARMTDVFDAEGNLIPRDPQELDRLLQLYQLDRYLRAQRNPRSRAVIVAGDFNVSPEMSEYEYMMALTGFENSFDAVNPGGNPSTYSTENVFVTQECSRIDHVMYKNHDGTDGFSITPSESKVVMTELFTEPEKFEMINYSDHYGVMTTFEVSPDQNAGSLSPPGVGALDCNCQQCPPAGYDRETGVLKLTSANLEAWQRQAVNLLREAYEKQDRENPVLVQLAEIVAAEGTAEIKFEGEAKQEIEKIVCDEYSAKRSD